MRIPSPDDIWQSMINRLPRSVGGWVWNLSYIVAWITLPYSIVSAIGDLRLVLDSVAWLYEHAGVVQPALDAIGPAIVGAMDVWRAFTAPLLNWLREALPFDIQQEYVDFALIVFVCLPSLARYLFQSRTKERIALLAKSKQDLLDKQVAEAERERAAASAQRNEGGGAGVLIGAAVGGIIGMIFPPALPAAVAIGARIGGTVGSTNASDAPDRSSEIRALRDSVAREGSAVALAEQRVRQARRLLRVTLVVASLALALVIADALLRASGVRSNAAEPAERPSCETSREPGEPCACLRDQNRVGVSRATHDGERNYCWVG